MWPTWRSSISDAERTASARRRPPSRRTCTALRIGASGLRSSCASIARNSSLRRSASDRSFARLAQVALRPRLRSVMSRTILDAPTTLPVVVLDRRDGERNVEQLAVGPQALGLEVFDPFPGSQTGDDLVFLGDPVRRDDQGDVAADRLRGV